MEIDNARFTILGPFNTGGDIKFENCSEASVNNSSFALRGKKDVVGVAGGAITSEGSNLTIDNSIFNTGKGSYVQESGGLIQVAGTGHSFFDVPAGHWAQAAIDSPRRSRRT